MKEREISLADLAVEIALQWRQILAVMLAGAVLAGAFSYARSYQAAKAMEEEVQFREGNTGTGQAEPLKELEGSMTDAQIQKVKDVLAYEEVYKSRRAYQKHAAFMQIDPQQVHQAELTFYISSASRQDSCDIEKVYEDIVQGGAMHTYAAKQAGQDPADLAEVVLLDRGSGALAYGSNTFKVRIIHSDKDICQALAAAVKSFLQEKQEELETNMGAHRLEVIQQSAAVVSDLDILERQKNVLNDILSMSDMIAQRKAAFTEEEERYYDLLTLSSAGSKEGTDHPAGSTDAAEDETAASKTPASEIPEPGIRIKYVIFGMVLAAFAYIFILFMKYVLGEKLCAADQLEELYQIPQLGMVPGRGSVKKRFCFLDQWILSLRNHNKRQFTREEALQLSAAAVRMQAVKEGLGHICLASCGLHKGAWEICEALKGQLEQEGIRCEILDHLIYDAQAMRRLETLKGAVLVECIQSTRYGEIHQELELLKRQEIVVLGGIIVE